MAHMVIFQTPDGNPGYNQFDTVEAAVAFVEQLRNEQGVSNARMFALEEIKFDFKPYYRVELAALTTGTGPASTVAPPPAPISAAPVVSSTPAPEAPPAPPEPESPAHDDSDDTSPAATAPSNAADLSSPVGVGPVTDGEPQLRRGLFGR